MTPRQRELARHALGLPNDRRRSYRNRFLAGGLCEDWNAMTAAGLAEAGQPDDLGRTWFWLTRAGAEAALDRGEMLCPEDFPQAETEGGHTLEIPAITIWQPWATLIVMDAKPYEFRGWAAPAKFRGKRIGIHAGARPVKRSEVADLLLRLRSAEAWTTCLRPEIALPILEKVHTTPQVLPLSHMLGTAVLGAPIRADEIVGEFGGVLNDSDRDLHSNWAWPLGEIQPLEPPVPARGAQGFWNWAGELRP